MEFIVFGLIVFVLVLALFHQMTESAKWHDIAEGRQIDRALRQSTHGQNWRNQ